MKNRAVHGTPKQVLAHAIQFAVRAHGDMLDRGGDLAILHPLAVMALMNTPTEKAVAILHDVVEDSPVTLEEVRHEFGNDIGDSVDALSRREAEKYFDYIARVKQNALATRVKLADLAHNSSDQRLGRLPESERGIVKRYDKARKILTRNELSEYDVYLATTDESLY